MEIENSKEDNKGIGKGSKERKGKEPLKGQEYIKALEKALEEYRKVLDTYQTREERLIASLELERKKEEIKHGTGTPGLEIISFNEYNALEAIGQEHAKKNPDNMYRWTNTHNTVLSSRKAQGYSVVRAFNDETGKEEPITLGDAILVSIKREKYEKEIEAVRRRKRELTRKAILTNFTDSSAEAGVEAFGKIKYDDGSEVSVGEE